MQKAIKFGVTFCMVPAYAIELVQPTASTDTPATSFASMLQDYAGELETFAHLDESGEVVLHWCNLDAQGFYEGGLRGVCDDLLDES